MFFVIVFLLFLFYLSIKNRFFLFSILPIFLLINYIFFYVIASGNFIKNPFLDLIFVLYQLDYIYGFDYQLINSITFRSGLIYSLILIFSYLLSNLVLIKNLASKLLKIIFSNIKSLSLLAKKSKFKLSYNIINQIIFALILIHAFSFYTAENVMFHREYLSILKYEFYYFYPFITIVLSKTLVILILPLYFISKYLQKGFRGFRELQTLIVISHTYIYLSALNSRWITVYLIIFIIFTVYSLLNNKKSNLLTKCIQSAAVIFIGSIPTLFSFQKVIFYRNQISGIGTVFQFNSFEFTPFETLGTFFISFFTSLLPFYSGVVKDINVSLKYALISLNPLPSSLLGNNLDLDSLSERISIYVPSPFYLEIYQSYFLYGIIISLFFSFAFAIIRIQKKLLSNYEGKYNIVNIYPIAFEFFLVSGLLFGYQYYARAVMRFYWYAIFIFIILPFLVNYFSRFFKRY